MSMIEVRGLRVVAGIAPETVVEIVKGVDFTVEKGEVLALIGESGSGKTTIALSLLGHARGGCSIAGGSVRIGGVDVLSLDEKGRRALRARAVAYVAQSASAGFNPARTIMDQVIEPALLHKLMTPAAARAKAIELFRSLALPAPETIGSRYPHQVSGGQLQRLMAAMALITDPAVVVFDEPTTALDVIVQGAVMQTIKDLQRDRGFTAILISHDLGVVLEATDRVMVMYAGEIVEDQPAKELVRGHHHPYTEALLGCYADPRAEEIKLGGIPGSPPDLSAPPMGCPFAPRCPLVEDICHEVDPPLTALGGGTAACHVRAREAKVEAGVGHAG